MKTRPIAFFLIVFFTLFSTSGQYLYKLGAQQATLQNIFSFAPIAAGLAFYFVAAVLMMLALKKAQLSVVYPFIAMSYIWVAILAAIFFNEAMKISGWLGIISVVAGVSLVGYGAEHE